MIKRELALFLVVGSLTVMVDFMVYRSLVWMGLVGIDMAKAISFLVGTVLAYCANRFWTFGHKLHAPGSAWRFALLYAATLGANVVVNALALALLADAVAAIQLAFLLATGVSASLNFLGMKLLVFKAGTASGLE
jgi:putative flippase GtrA